MSLAAYLARPETTAIGLARQLGVAHTTVLRWAERRVPAERVRQVAELTGVPPHQLRPDLFDAPAPAEAA